MHACVWQAIFAVMGIVSWLDNLNKWANREMKAAIMKSFMESKQTSKMRHILVHHELYQKLMLGKAYLAMKWNDRELKYIPTFADVIEHWYNKTCT